MSWRKLCPLFLSVSLLSGCTSLNGIWEPKYQTARSADTPHTRLTALTAVAEAAADSGDVATMKKALADLSTDECHDAVAERCAIRLGSGGHPFAARETAQMVKDEAKRKTALAKVGW